MGITYAGGGVGAGGSDGERMAVESFVQTYNQRDAQAAAPGREVVALSATPSGGS